MKDAALLDMKATDKIVLNGVAYNLGIGSAIPVVPDVPECTITHINGT